MEVMLPLNPAMIKRPIDTESVLGHFRTDRQILAGLQYPNVARLLDGGAIESAKRGGEVQVLRLDDGLDIAGGRTNEMIALDEALTVLAKLTPRQSEVVELRYFAGVSVEEEAAAMPQVSPE